jgi:hypothetical protein
VFEGVKVFEGLKVYLNTFIDDFFGTFTMAIVVTKKALIVINIVYGIDALNTTIKY